VIKKPSIRIAFLFLAFFTIQVSSYAQSRQIPRLEPDPKALEFHDIAARNPDLSWTYLAELSLWASGDTSLSNMQKIRDAVSLLNNSNSLPSPGRERAEYILEFLHTNILRTFSMNQTRVDTVFSNGRFNCVSSAVLYTILCKSAGISTSGVVTKEHAFVIVHISGQNIDVETTNRYGFEPGNRKEFHDQFGRLTGFSYVPAQNYRDRQTINQVELVSLILNNRIAELERANRFPEAVPLAVDRTVLLLGSSMSDNNYQSSDTFFENPKKDLTDRLINYGSSILSANREEECLNWAAAASSRYPDPARWQELIMAAINNRIARFIRERRPADARIFLENNAFLLSRENYLQIDAMLLDAELLQRANNIRTAQEGYGVVNDIAEAKQNEKIPQKRAIEILTFAVQKTAAVLCAAPDMNWRAAINYIETVLSLYGSNRELEQNLQIYRSNLAADYHNRFAAEWNKRNFEEAERILNEGLAEFPDNRQLLSNREIVNRQNSR